MYPSMEELQTLAGTGKYRRLPLCRELYSDRFTPIEVMRILRAASKHCVLLESAEDKSQWGRYSFLGYEPKLELSCAQGRLRLRYDPESEDCREEILNVTHPGEKIREILAEYRSPALPQLPPFTGGLVGYFSFEYLQYAEPELRETAPKGEEFQSYEITPEQFGYTRCGKEALVGGTPRRTPPSLVPSWTAPSRAPSARPCA